MQQLFFLRSFYLQSANESAIQKAYATTEYSEDKGRRSSDDGRVVSESDVSDSRGVFAVPSVVQKINPCPGDRCGNNEHEAAEKTEFTIHGFSVSSAPSCSSQVGQDLLS